MGHAPEKIIFLHVPRTGGSTFRHILKAWFPKETRHVIIDGERQILGRIKKDPYEAKKRILNVTKRVIYGHFAFNPMYAADKYFLCTFIRHPVDWTISRWSYLEKQGSWRWGDLQNKSVSEFMDAGFVNMQSKFLQGSQMSDFNFIGITDRYVQSLRMFLKSFPQISTPENWHEFVRQYRAFGNKAPLRKITEDEKAEILERNQKDLNLYNKISKQYDTNFCAG